MSIGFLVEDDKAMVWRGPMATRRWNSCCARPTGRELDYLVVDMPPGTGDIQLTLSAEGAADGAVIVTTPQDIALIDARRA